MERAALKIIKLGSRSLQITGLALTLASLQNSCIPAFLFVVGLIPIPEFKLIYVKADLSFQV
jgi:hypothetical protein